MINRRLREFVKRYINLGLHIMRRLPLCGRAVKIIEEFFQKEYISLSVQEIENLIPKDVFEKIKDLKNEDFIAHNQAIFFSTKNIASAPPPTH